MSETTFRKNRKKGLAVSMIAGLCSLTLIGGTYAALSANVATDPGTESIVNTLTWDYRYSVTSDPIVASVTPVENPSAQTFVKAIENNTSIDSHYALWFGGVDVEDIPQSILDNTLVKITVDDGVKNTLIQTSLNQLFTRAYVFVENDEGYVLAPQTGLTITIEVTAPEVDGVIDYTDALEFTSADFITTVSFNQVIGGTSDLFTYASNNATAGDENVLLVPMTGGAFTY